MPRPPTNPPWPDHAHLQGPSHSLIHPPSPTSTLTPPPPHPTHMSIPSQTKPSLEPCPAHTLPQLTTRSHPSATQIQCDPIHQHTPHLHTLTSRCLAPESPGEKLLVLVTGSQICQSGGVSQGPPPLKSLFPGCVAPMVYLDCSNTSAGTPGAECLRSCHTLDVDCVSVPEVAPQPGPHCPGGG